MLIPRVAVKLGFNPSDEEEKMINLGNEVRDIVSGFQGIATAHVKYLNGCSQYCVTPKSTDGKMPDSQYFDYQRLEIVGDGIAVRSSDTGGEMRDSPSSSYRG